MKIHPEPQGSLEWLLARAGVLTASEMDSLVTPNFEMRKGEMVQTLLARKLAEKWIGGPLAGFMSIDMDIGRILEDEAIPFYELETGQHVERVGLLTTDDGRVGCSPDGLLGDRSGIEIKCPRQETQIKYLLSGVLPKDYAAQVHTAMLVTGRQSWQFMSYARHLPPLLLTVERDGEIIEQLQDAITEFLVLLDAGFERLCEINGGPPQRRTAAARSSVPDPERDLDVSIP